MGPRLFRRGNDNQGAVDRTVHFTSMGPRLFRRGNGFPEGWTDLNRLTSMGPRLFRRGNFGPAIRVFVDFLNFNGATPFQTWKLEILVGEKEKKLTSMGPRLFRRGNCLEVLLVELSLPALQWGHAFSDVETLCLESVRPQLSYFNGATPFQTWKQG